MSALRTWTFAGSRTWVSMPDTPMFLNIVQMVQASIDSGEMKLINSDFASSSLMRLTSGALQVAFCFSHGFDVGHPAVQERSVVGWESSEASQQRQARWSDISSGIKELRLRTPYVRSHAVDDCQIRRPRHLLRWHPRALRYSWPLNLNRLVSDRAIFISVTAEKVIRVTLACVLSHNGLKLLMNPIGESDG